MKQTLKKILAILLVFIFIVQASPLQSFAASLHSDECAFLADAGEADFNTYDSVGNITSFTFTPAGSGRQNRFTTPTTVPTN